MNSAPVFLTNMTYRSVSEFYKEKFGCKVYKISLDAGCTCPTRDGTKGEGGCIFCSASGSGDFAANRNLPIEEQIEQAKQKVASKLNKGSGKFIAYFQNFTNTYGDINRLEKLWFKAASSKDIVGVAIATRPDCLAQPALDAISRLSKITFTSIELGLQTTNEKSINYIRRNFENSVYDQAVKKLHDISKKIHVVTHVIFGLPGETEKDMIETVKHAVKAGTDGIKITVLHVLKNTDLAEDYLEHKFECLSMEQYFELLAKALKVIPPEVVVHRLTGDGAKNILIAPLWTADKKKVHNSLRTFLENYKL
ncbi:MAG: TIGR01212 family radical SAM protein [Treponemataceae bacterium]|nr:TIGR01212 family radical SAM protein [Treponemataceae bacterium]